MPSSRALGRRLRPDRQCAVVPRAILEIVLDFGYLLPEALRT